MAVPKHVVSAGGVIYKLERGKPYVCLIERTDREVWGLPKGEIGPGESPEEAALREVEEETGLEGKIEMKLGAIDYWFCLPAGQAGWGAEKARYHKTVHFFLMKQVGGDTSAHDWEVKSAAWFPIEEALAKMAYKNERDMVEKAKAVLTRSAEQ